MPPEDSSNRPPAGRQPYPRRRMAGDRPQSAARPLYANRGIARPETARPPEPVPPPRPITAPQPSVVDIAPPSRPQPQPVKQSVVASKPAILDFTPPQKKKRRLIVTTLPKMHKPSFKISRFVIGFVLVALVIAAGTGFAYLRTNQNTDDTVLRQALAENLSTSKFHSQTNGPNRSDSIDYDLSTATDPTISAVTTVSLGGGAAQIISYGDTKNTYISYTQLPTIIPAATISTVKDNWVQLRTNGVAPTGVPAALARAADPRYQAFGPLLFGTPSAALKKQLLDYMFNHQIYDYSGTKPAHDMMGNIKVIRYDVKPDASNLKIVNQSLATSENLAPADIQAATAALDQLKGATMHLYIATKSHRIIRMELTKNDQTTTTDYSHFGNAALAAEPQTHLNWSTFAATQFKMASLVASKQPAASLDILRKNQLTSLHIALKNYFNQTGSYPSFTNMNDQAWIAANLPDVDGDAVRDPLGVSQTVFGVVKAGSLTYQPSGSVICDNTAVNPCLHYKLTTVLSTNQQYSVQDP